MPRANPIFTSFLAGCWSPRKDGRTDEKAYYHACKTLENWIPLPQGGVTRRPGSYYIAGVKDQAKDARLIEFIYSTDTAYVLEFGHQTLRFFKDGGQILDAGSPYEIATPYSSTELQQIRFVQSADTMYLAHPSHAPQKLTRAGDTSWTMAAVDWNWIPFQDPDEDMPHVTPSAFTGTGISITSEELVANGEFDSGITSWTDQSDPLGTFAWNASGYAELNGNGTDCGWMEQAVTVEPGETYTLEYTTVVGFAGSAVVMAGTASKTGDIYQSNMSTGSPSVEITIPAGTTTIYLGFKNNHITLTSVDDVSFFLPWATADDVGENLKLTWPTVEARQTVTVTAANQWSSALTVTAGTVNVSVDYSGSKNAVITVQRSYDNGTTWTDVWRDTAAAAARFDTLLEAATGARYRIGCATGEYTSGTVNCYVSQAQTNQAGYATVTAFVNARELTADVVIDFPATSKTDSIARGAWSDTKGWPRAVAFFEQRLVWAGNTILPNTLWASCVGDYENIETGTGDSNAWVYTLAGDQVNAIRWLLAGTVLQIGTYGGEWRMGSPSEPTTPTNVDVKRETAWGSADVQALAVGSLALYIQRGGQNLRAIQYTFQEDAWSSPIISRDAEHLLRDGVTAMSFAASPDPCLWMVTGAGDLVHVAFDHLTGMKAFSKQTLGGVAESVCVIPGTAQDEVWVIVRRTINGSTTRYVEQIQPLFEEGGDLEDAFFVDSGLTYDGAATSTISGLSHLEGETVAVHADGASHATKTVSSGAITLDRPAEKVHVGLPISAKGQTMRFDTGRTGATAQGRQARAFKTAVRVNNTMGLSMGSEETKVEAIPWRKAGAVMDAPPALFSGDKEVEFDPPEENALHFWFIAPGTGPATVTAIMPRVYSSLA